jgi:hypothetical protein
MGETRVDLLHLLEDLRDAYPGALEEAILTEILANALDSRARAIRVTADAPRATLTILDDGSGMQRRELRRFHDIAASSKTRGEGIGFAGVGVKLGLLVSEHVLTETRRGKTHVATRWHLASRHRAPWRWVAPAGLVAERGTAVVLRLRHALSPLLDAGFLETTIRRHYQPLFEASFRDVLAHCYPDGVALTVNDRLLAPGAPPPGEVAPLAVRLLRKRKPSAVGYLQRAPVPLGEDERGLAISTYGKTIKRGWDWLGLTPATPERIGGLIEAPALAACLTLNKADFVRTGVRGAAYLAHRKAIQQAVAAQLETWGDSRDAAGETQRRAARPLERDLERVLMDLAADFPLIATLVQQRKDGQRRLPLAHARAGGNGPSILAALTERGRGESTAPASPTTGSAADTTDGASDAGGGKPSPPAGTPAPDDAAAPERPATTGPAAAPRAAAGARPANRLGLGIQFEERPDDPEIARLIESTVWVNTAHPAYRRAHASRAEGYHVALATALALAPLAVEPAAAHTFVTAFLASWGESAGRRERRAR